MSYGASIYINGTAFDVVNAFAPSYVLDIITGVSSGSRTYSVPPTTTITATAMVNEPDSSFNPAVSISGGIVTWSGLGGGILIVYGA